MSAITTSALRYPNVRLSITDPKSACQEWSVMGRTGVERAQAPPPIGWSAAGTVAAYAAAIVAFAYAPVSLYWAAGGHGLLSTVGGYVEQLARQGGALPVLVALAAVVAKVAGGLLALALVRALGDSSSAPVAAAQFRGGQCDRAFQPALAPVHRGRPGTLPLQGALVMHPIHRDVAELQPDDLVIGAQGGSVQRAGQPAARPQRHPPPDGPVRAARCGDQLLPRPVH